VISPVMPRLARSAIFFLDRTDAERIAPGNYKLSPWMSAGSRMGFGAPRQTVAIIARPTPSVVKTTLGMSGRSNANNGPITA